MGMSLTTKLQTIAGVIALVSMPVLYLGGISRNGLLETVGFLMLAFAMLSTPAIKLVTSSRRRRTVQRHIRS
jgi:hypothetical protein